MALMLVDTRDPRYEPDPEADRWRPNMRVWTPFGASVACFVTAYFVGPLTMFVLTVVGMMLFFDGLLSLFPSGDGLKSHRQ